MTPEEGIQVLKLRTVQNVILISSAGICELSQWVKKTLLQHLDEEND